MRAAATLAVAFTWAASPAQAASSFEFGAVLQGRFVEHEFELANDGAEPIRITSMEVEQPMQLQRLPAVVAPGASAKLRVLLDTTRLKGKFRGLVRVSLSDGRVPEFVLEGNVVPPIEVLPRSAFFVSTARGSAKSAELEIISHEDEALGLWITHAPTALGVRLESIEAGRRYRLSLRVPSDAAAGRAIDRIELRTSSDLKPVLRIAVNTVVRERVHTFPDVVDLGTLRRREAPRPELAQTLMVYQTGGHDFNVEASTDVPGLRLQSQPGPTGDRVQVTVWCAQPAPGPVRGEIVLRTNDPEFRELRVPVTGEILSD
jgi:hypothetical protein